MERSEIFGKVRGIVADHLGKEPDEIQESSAFVEDLGADSLDVVELVMNFEDEFGIEISDEDFENVHTVGDAVETIVRKKKLSS